MATISLSSLPKVQKGRKAGVQLPFTFTDDEAAKVAEIVALAGDDIFPVLPTVSGTADQELSTVNKQLRRLVKVGAHLGHSVKPHTRVITDETRAAYPAPWQAFHAVGYCQYGGKLVTEEERTTKANAA